MLPCRDRKYQYRMRSFPIFGHAHHLGHGHVHGGEADPHNQPRPDEAGRASILQCDTQSAEKRFPRTHQNGTEAEHGHQAEVALDWRASLANRHHLQLTRTLSHRTHAAGSCPYVPNPEGRWQCHLWSPGRPHSPAARRPPVRPWRALQEVVPRPFCEFTRSQRGHSRGWHMNEWYGVSLTVGRRLRESTGRTVQCVPVFAPSKVSVPGTLAGASEFWWASRWRRRAADSTIWRSRIMHSSGHSFGGTRVGGVVLASLDSSFACAHCRSLPERCRAVFLTG